MRTEDREAGLGALAAAARRERLGAGPGLTAAYIAAVATATAAWAVPAIARLDTSPWAWGTFALFASCAAVAQLFGARAARDPVPVSLTFLVAAALLLPAGLVALLGVAQYSLVWARERSPWRDRVFSLCRSTLAALAAALAARVAAGGPLGAHHTNLTWAVAGLVACLVFGAVDRLLLAGLLSVREGRGATVSMLLSPSQPEELLLAALGVGVAAVWRFDPWLLPFVAAPLLVVHRSLHVPRLEEQARVDPKTGLYNSRHFVAALEDELARARRLGRPLSLVMADLDHLREINNAHGHLAGDSVLAGVARIFRSQLRPYDVAARFGGEEFALILPETSREQAIEIAQRVREAVAGSEFHAASSDEPIRVTISLGIASYPDDAGEAGQLVHFADVAVYRAKVQGRNRVIAAGEGLLDTGRAPRLVSIAGDGAASGVSPPPPGRILRRLHLPSRRRALEWSTGILSFLGVAGLVLGAIVGAPRLALALGAAALLPVLLARRSQTSSVELTRRRAEKLWRAADAMHTRLLSAERANKLLRRRSEQAMETLSAAVDARDSHTAGHSRRVQRVALAIGQEFGMSERELEVLGHAALFHDIGKLAVPEAILLKPARLDPREWRIVKRHPDEGARLIQLLGFLEDAIPAIRHHHERYDGSGYPEHLRGEEIPLGARIIHVADALDAMLTPRVYRPALSPVAALDELRDNAGTQFCPRVVGALDRILLAELLDGADVPYALLAS